MNGRVCGVLVAGLMGCGGGEGPRGTEVTGASVADSGAPAWCAPLSEVQQTCHLDPLQACAARNPHPSATAYACGTFGPAPSDCVGFPADPCSFLVYCCGAP